MAFSAGAELRDLTEADADELHALVEANRSHLAPWLPWAAGPQAEGTLNYLRKTAEKRERGGALDCAIVLDGRIAGCAGFATIEPPARLGVVGYWRGGGNPAPPPRQRGGSEAHAHCSPHT